MNAYGWIIVGALVGCLTDCSRGAAAGSASSVILAVDVVAALIRGFLAVSCSALSDLPASRGTPVRGNRLGVAPNAQPDRRPRTGNRLMIWD